MHDASPLARSAAVLVAVTVAGFSPTLSASFVYDARLQILTDPFLHDLQKCMPQCSEWCAVLCDSVPSQLDQLKSGLTYQYHKE